MSRRLAALALSAAIIFAGVAAGSCVSGASCALAQARQMDCCTGAGTGISAPRCCQGPPQLGHNTTPATLERLVHSAPAAVPVVSAPVVPASTSSTQSFQALRLDPGAAQPGGTLIAQHTSLLL